MPTATDHWLRSRSRGTVSKSQRYTWLALPFVLAAFSLLTVGYLNTFTPATILIGSRVLNVHTHQTNVSNALREAGIELFPEDSVTPPLTAPLNRFDTIIIKRAHLVRVIVDDEEPRFVRTQSTNAVEVLSQLEYEVGERDALAVNGEPTTDLPVEPLVPAQFGAAPERPLEPIVADVQLKHAVELHIQEQDDPPVTVLTTAPTIGEALMQAGYKLYLADTVRPSPGERAKSGTHVFISRSQPISVIADGRRIKTRTHRNIVADVLADLNIVLYGKDYTQPALDARLSADTEIRVVRVRTEVLINQDIIPFDTRVEPDPELELDYEALGQQGAPGVRERRTLVTYEDDAEVSRETIADFVAKPPQPKIYTYGTKVVVRSLMTEAGEVQYWRVIRMLATSYSASTAGVSRSASYYGKVRCGMAMRHGFVAVDPRIIPLRTDVYVPGYGAGNACDTGSAIIGKRIDLGYDDDNLVLWYKWVDVYLLTPVPDNIRYRLN